MAFVERFVVKPGKREKFVSWLKNERRHGRFLEELDHFRWALDDRYVWEIPSGEEYVDSVERLLCKLGAPDECVVICNEGDCGSFSLRHALETLIGSGYGAIVSCVAGELAYYQEHDNYSTFVCAAPHSADPGKRGSL